MATLFDALNNIKNKPQQSQQSELQRIARARTGKARQAVGPRASNIGEQAAIAGTRPDSFAANLVAGQQAQQASQIERGQQLQVQQQRQQLQSGLTNLQSQGRLARAEQAQQRELGQQRIETTGLLRTNELTNRADQALKQLATQRNVTTQELFRSFSRQQQGLATDRDIAQLEQAGFAAALKSKDYVEKLNRIGRENRLQNETQFRAEAAEVAFGEDLARIIKNTEYQDILAEDARETNRRVENMKLDVAVDIARSKNLGSNYSQIIGGATKLGTALAEEEE